MIGLDEVRGSMKRSLSLHADVRNLSHQDA